MLKFDLYEKYLKQDEKHQEMLARYVDREQQAGQRIQDLKSEAEAVLREELRTGIDKSTDKERIRKEIAEAEAAYVAAQYERVEAYSYASQPCDDTITSGDVVMAFNNDYLQKVQAVELAPVEERMRKAKAEYMNCIADLLDLEQKYAPIKKVMHDKCYSYYSNGKNGASPVVKDVVEWSRVPKLTDHELRALENYRQFPSNIERVKTTI